MQNNVAGIVEQAPVQSPLFELESMAKSHIKKIEDTRAEMKQRREELSDLLMENDEYRETSNRHLELTNSKSSLKKKLMENEKAQELKEVIEELNSDIKDSKQGLSTYLDQLKKGGKDEIEDHTGRTRTIKQLSFV